ncbi:hypothetical protein GCM10010532_010000 [Dactylosporangium siamense]|uniref:Uncharacterized protein n=1 Tax=Dactylosporangium siamense TaxID=685454 RepID=A0A919PFA2_9ACTN|nr:hypothetical protein Dsi01nite_009100 [Dactylosporangium siamense]
MIGAMSDPGAAGVTVLLWALGCASIYLVVRAAVRAGIEDAWKRRARREDPQP